MCSCHLCRMFCLLQNIALLLSVQHWQLENGGKKYCDFLSGIYTKVRSNPVIENPTAYSK